MASSERSLGSELLKRQYSPSFWARSARWGLLSHGSNGPRRPPRGPATMASATFFCSGVSLLRSSGARRGMRRFPPVGMTDGRLQRAAGVAGHALVGVVEHAIDDGLARILRLVGLGSAGAGGRPQDLAAFGGVEGER